MSRPAMMRSGFIAALRSNVDTSDDAFGTLAVLRSKCRYQQ
jgi:hypothetical protein